MKHIFLAASHAKDGGLATYKHPFTIYLPVSTTGWTFDGRTHEKAESWLAAVSRKLLLLGITEVQCMSNEPSKGQAAKFTFYFAHEAERYRFEAAAFNNKTGIYKRRIDSDSADISYQRQKNVESFRAATELDFSIHRFGPRRFTITSFCSHDDLIIAIQIADKSFDLGIPQNSPENKLPLLLKHNEKV